MAPLTRFPSFTQAQLAKQNADYKRQFSSLPKQQKHWVILAKVVQALKASDHLSLKMGELENQVIRSQGFRDFLGEGGLGDILRQWSNKIKVSYSFFDYPLTVELIDPNYEPGLLWRNKGIPWHPQHVFTIAFENTPHDQAKRVIEQFNFETPPAHDINAFGISDELSTFLEKFKPTQKEIRQTKRWVADITKEIYSVLELGEEVIHVGSWDNGLALNISAIDFGIIPHDPSENEPAEAEKVFRKLRHNLQTEMDRFNSSIGECSTLSFYHPGSNLSFIINYGSNCGLNSHSGDLGLAYAKLNPIVHDLMMMIKLWSCKRLINRPSYGTLASLSYQGTLLAYLISIGVIPNLQSTCEDHKIFKVSEDWHEFSVKQSPFRSNQCTECGKELPEDIYYFNDNITLQLTTLNPEFTLYNLFMSYLKFMSAQFDPQHMALSMAGGGIVPRHGGDGHQSWSFTPNQPLWFCDPFHPTKNIAFNVNTSAKTGILWEMQRAHTILKHDPQLTKLFMDYELIPPQLFIEMGIYPAAGEGNESLTSPQQS